MINKSIIVLIFLCYPLILSGTDNNIYDEIQLAEISGPTNYIEQAFDVLHYDAEINLTAFPSTEMTGVCRISVEWKDNPTNEKFYFNLRDLTVDSVFYENLKVDAVEVGDKNSATYHYEVTVPLQISKSLADITVFYHGKMTTENNEYGGKWGGVQYGGGILFAMGVGFYNNYVSSTQHWLACYDHPSDKATYKCKFIVPAGKVVASNGTVSVEYLDNGTDVYTWEHKYPCATYNLTFAVGDYHEFNFGNEDLQMVVYSLAADTTACKTSFKLLPRMVETYSKLFGDYPFEKVGYVLTPIGSMEHQTMVSFARSIARRNDTINNVAAHELSHQWFGDLITPYDFSDAWFNEGFATFCESIWYEELFGFGEYLDRQEANVQTYLKRHNEGILPLYDFPRIPPSSNYPGTIYLKGAAVVGMLRYELGDSLFFGGIKEFVKLREYGNTSTDILKEILEEFSGKELDWFFNQWVYRKGWLAIEVFVEEAEGAALYNYEVLIKQVQDSTWGIFENVPIEIGFSDGEGNMEYHIFNLSEKEQYFSIGLNNKCNVIFVNNGPSVRTLLDVRSEIVSVVENKKIISNSIEIYPNPGELNITIIFSADDGFARISLFNESGVEVINDEIKTRKGSNQYLLNSEKIPSGRYFIIINDGKVIYKDSLTIIH